jgi:hypothetical protein
MRRQLVGLGAAPACVLLSGCSHHTKPDTKQTRDNIAQHRGRACHTDKDCPGELVCRDDADLCTPSACGDGPQAPCTSDCGGEVCMEPEGWF